MTYQGQDGKAYDFIQGHVPSENRPPAGRHCVRCRYRVMWVQNAAGERFTVTSYTGKLCH